MIKAADEGGTLGAVVSDAAAMRAAVDQLPVIVLSLAGPST